MDLISAIFEVLQKSTIGDVLTELVKFLSPLWIAFLVGIVVGWSWKPKWVNLGREKLDCSISKPSSPLSNSSFGFRMIQSLNSSNVQLRISDDRVDEDKFSVLPDANPDCHLSELKKEESVVVSREDLEHLCQLVEEKDGGPAWIQMMDRSTPNMNYQAWRRDPQTGPPQYRSRTVFEDATPELVRDFFWDDEFRLNWDTMIIYASTLEECPTTGTMVVQWIRKFPFFCSDREYIIGRRIWESGRSYYCVTKGIPYPAVPGQDKPRRVDLFYSSWCIRAVESKRGDGQLTACEVLLFHHEDMGIPWEIAKLGIRQGMWGAVKKIEPALRAYQKVRKSGAPLSRCTFMAQINTKINADYLRSLETTTNPSNETLHSTEKPVGINVSKFILIGGALILACSLDRGLLTKTVIFGVARRFAKIGRRL